MRVLYTFWLYDRDTYALFTSDAFSHFTMSRRSSARMVDCEPIGRSHAARNHLLATMPWLRRANTHAVREDLNRIFASRRVDLILPTHGCVIKGRDLVERQVSEVDRVLALIDATSAAVGGGYSAKPK